MRPVTGEGFVHIGRQPIFDTAGAVVGYELLFRASASATTADVVDGDQATAQVIVNTFTEFGLGALVGSGLAFINLTRPFITGDLLPPFDPDQVVLEILEDIPADPDVVAGCERLVEKGYRIAVDDIAPNDPRRPLLALASFAKLDFLQCTRTELAAIAAECHAAGVTLVAEKVDSEEDMQTARDLGCSMFQGHHLARAQVVSTPTLNPQRINCLRLLSALADQDISLERINELVSREPALAVRVLTAANSAAAGITRRIESVREALVLLGTRQLRSWLQLMLLGNLSDENSELFAAAVIRAKTCELLAAERPGIGSDAAFTVGLLSSLDRLLAQPIDEIVSQMDLSPELRLALVANEGPMGELLSDVRRFEQGEEPQPGRASAEVAHAFLTSVEWWQRGAGRP